MANHWLDCLVGSAVAASIQGTTLPGLTPAKKPRREISLSAIQEARRAGRPVEPLLRGYRSGQYDAFKRQQGGSE